MPIIKRFHTASFKDSGELIIGVTPDSTVELEINEDWVMSLLGMLDGRLNVEQLEEKLHSLGYQISADQIINFLETLDEANIIEDSNDFAKATAASGLTKNEIERYDRQLLLFQSQLKDISLAVDAQNKIKNTRIAIIGLGGTGSYILYGLAAMGFGHIKGVDFDRVEWANLSRQILYTEKDIGKFKHAVAAEKAPLINSHSTYDFINLKVDSVETAMKTLEGADLAIITADNPRPKIWEMYSKASFEQKVPILYSGSAETWVVCGPLIIPEKTCCFNCCFPELTYNNNPVSNAIMERYTTTLIDPYNSIGASLAVLEAVKFITNFQECRIVGKRLFLDLGKYETYLVGEDGKENCEVCGYAVTH